MAEASSSKRACVDAAGDDRLSALPDALLCSVMSFLTARQAVQTSALSRRWRDLWCSMPCLDIDHREFQTVPGVTGCRYPDNCFVWRKLENFTANLLMYHRAPVLDSFRLRVGGLHVDQVVDRWVRRGVRYRPVVLEITMASTQQKLRLPPLGPAPRMKRLQLCRVRLDGGFAGHLRSQCPVLEELELKDCDCDFQEIASATLKRLAIEGSRRVYDDGDLPFSVAAPALASLRLGFPQCTDPDVLLVNGGAEFLLQASISGCCEFIGKYLFGLLGRLCNVRTLELWSFSYPNAKLPNEEKEMFPKLNNLTTLLMGKCDMSKQFDILQLFLHNAPRLETVTLQHCVYTGTSRKKGARRKISPQHRKLVSLESRDLNLIEIKYKEGNTGNLFRLLMSIRTRLEKNTVVLIKEKDRPVTD